MPPAETKKDLGEEARKAKPVSQRMGTYIRCHFQEEAQNSHFPEADSLRRETPAHTGNPLWEFQLEKALRESIRTLNRHSHMDIKTGLHEDLQEDEEPLPITLYSPDRWAKRQK